jgi:HD-GYP domain-containing protein (c-di-GMP phosphodiesterase class II)
MKKHIIEGASICNSLGITDELTKGVLYHHERWDGKGYPHGLKGEAIPFIARVLSIADAIDAMSSNRAYRSARDLATIREEIEKGHGTQFDPLIAQVVLQNWDTLMDLLQKAHEKDNHKMKCWRLLHSISLLR